MKKPLLFLVCVIASCTLPAQKKIDEIINVSEVRRIETVLAADDMKGRKVFTPEIDKAADFIAAEFKAAGLQPLGGGSFRQEFSIVRPKFISASAVADGQTIEQKKIIVVTSQSLVKADQKSGYEKIFIRAGSNLPAEARKVTRAGKNAIVLVDTSFSNTFGSLTRLKSQMFKNNYNIIFLLIAGDPQTWSVEAVHEINEQKLANVVGILPGKKKDEFVVFSGHYDHLGTGKPVNGDSIYNGANDDASGITAVIMLANYFKAAKDNERTLVFAAFTAEESGGYGSQYFSRQFEPEKVKAMFNIEMIGTESKWGKNSAFITGYEKTDMGQILEKDLKGSTFSFYPDPYPAQQLFYRSDNATLARLGVPAHTISTSKMDSEPNYHKLTDEVSTLDLDNMTMIIKAIALSSKSIIAGKETPSRVKVEELR